MLDVDGRCTFILFVPSPSHAGAFGGGMWGWRSLAENHLGWWPKMADAHDSFRPCQEPDFMTWWWKCPQCRFPYPVQAQCPTALVWVADS